MIKWWLSKSNVISLIYDELYVDLQWYDDVLEEITFHLVLSYIWLRERKYLQLVLIRYHTSILVLSWSVESFPCVVWRHSLCVSDHTSIYAFHFVSINAKRMKYVDVPILIENCDSSIRWYTWRNLLSVSRI